VDDNNYNIGAYEVPTITPCVRSLIKRPPGSFSRIKIGQLNKGEG